MTTRSLPAFRNLRSSTVATLDLGETTLAAIVVPRVTVLTAPKTPLIITPVPFLPLAIRLDVVNNLLQASVIWLQLGRKQHLNSRDERHSRVVASGMRISIFETAFGNEVTQTDLIAVARRGVFALLGQILSIDNLNHRTQSHGIEAQCGFQHRHITMESMAQHHNGTETQLWILLIDRPLERFLEHLLGLTLGQEASLTIVVPDFLSVHVTWKRKRRSQDLLVRIANTILDITQICVLQDPRMVEINLPKQVLSMHTSLLQPTRMPRVEGRDTKLGEPAVVGNPTLGVEAYDDHVFGSRGYAFKCGETETVREDFAAGLQG